MLKKRIPILLLTVFLSFLVFFMASCDKGEGESEVKLTGISVLESTVPQQAVVGELDVTTIRLVLKYSNGKTEEKTMDTSMLPEESQTKLQKAGTQTVTVVYNNLTAKFSIKLLAKTIPNYTLTVYNGIPTFIDGKKIQKSIEVSGDYYRQIYPEGTVVTVQWIDNGNIFSRWEANNLFLTDESTVDVTMTQDYTLWGYSEVSTSVVSFKSFLEKGSKELDSRTTDELKESDIPTISRPNYVFSGWTTDVIDEEAALDGYSENLVTFPYKVGRDVTFYATWKSVGVVYEKVEEHYEITGYTGSFEDLELPTYYLGLPVEKIRKDAFLTNGKTLLSLTLPETLLEIEEGAFAPCRNLAEIKLAQESRSFALQDGCLYDYEKTKFLCYPSGMITAELTVASGVREIADFAFYVALCGGIRLPQSVEYIGNAAFASEYIDFIDFSKIIPTALTMGENVFDEHISSLLLSSANYERFLSRFPQMNALQEQAVLDEEEVHKVYVYSYVEGNGEEVSLLYRLICEKDLIDMSTLSTEEAAKEESYVSAEILGVSRTVKSMAIPITFSADGKKYPVTSLAYRAFASCEKLSVITFPFSGKLQRICDDAFLDTAWLSSAGDSIQSNGILYKYLGNEKVVTLQSSIKRIAESAFYGNETLQYLDVTNNSSLQYIGAHAFDGCTSFVGFICNANEEGDGVYLKSSVRSIGKYAFRNTAVSALKLQESTSQLVNNLAIIDDYAFSSCRYLRSVTLSRSTVTVSNSAFTECPALAEFVLNEVNTAFVVYDGILYQKEGDAFTLACYPAGRIDGEFNPSYVKNYSSAMTVDYSLLEGVSDGKVGSVTVNGQNYGLLVHIVYADRWSVCKDVVTGKTTLMTEFGNELKTTKEVSYAEDGSFTVDGDYYFTFTDGEGKEIILLYDTQEETYYYYPTHVYYADEFEADLTRYSAADEEVGTVRFGNAVFPLYFAVTDGREIKLSATQMPLDKSNSKPLVGTKKVYYREDGTFAVDGEYYYYTYLTASKERKTVLCFDERKNGYCFEGYLNVTKIGENAFSYSNVGAVRLPSLLTEIEDGAFCAPGLSYLLFEGNPVSSYASIFLSCEPDVVLSANVSELDSLSFFNNLVDKKMEKLQYQPLYSFFYDYDAEADVYHTDILYAERSDNNNLYLMRASRTEASLELTEEVRRKTENGIKVYDENKIIYSYAFFGSILEKVTLRAVSALNSYSFAGADSLTQIFMETGFIDTVEQNAFGSKMNNGLYIYDNQNGVNSYRQNWGLDFFVYTDTNQMEHQASKYLIAGTDNLPFAVIYDKNEQGDYYTVDVFYGTITEEDVERIQSSISRIGYDISGWADEEGKSVSQSGYVIPYNQKLYCCWMPQEYTVYFVVNKGLTAEGALISDGVSAEIKYKTTVSYAEEYTFSLQGYEKAKYSFAGWMDGENVYNESAVWTYVPENRVITLYPVLEKKKYTLHLDLRSGESLTGEAEQDVIVYYDESFTLPVPEKPGAIFDGWYLTEGDKKVYLTDSFGKSLIGWKYSEEEQYDVYALWSENE